eukprot:3336152-Prymnesium_polylepis.1
MVRSLRLEYTQRGQARTRRRSGYVAEPQGLARDRKVPRTRPRSSIPPYSAPSATGHSYSCNSGRLMESRETSRTSARETSRVVNLARKLRVIQN